MAEVGITADAHTYDDLGRLTREQTAVPEDLLPPEPEPDPDPDPEPDPDPDPDPEPDPDPDPEPDPEPDPDPDPDAIILTLNPNGGTVTPGTVDITDAETYNLPTPTRTGYTFGGWYLGETEIQNGDPVTITESCTLTAQWTPITYLIRFDANGGTGDPPRTLFCAYAEDVTLPATTLTNGFKAFSGWSLSPNSGNIYAAGSVIQNLAAEDGAVVTLYARWGTQAIVPIDPKPPFVASYGLRSGSPLVVNRSTNEFAVLTKDGFIRTFFKPLNGSDYFFAQ